MQNADTLALMRREVAATLRQVERAQATAAALLQWYTNLGGDSFANGIDDQIYTDAGITKAQFKKAMADMVAMQTVLNPAALGNIADFWYKIQLIG